MPRLSIQSRGVALAAFAAGALTLSACTPPMPPDVLAAVAESQITCQTGDVAVGTPEEFFGAMSAVGGALQGVCPDQTVTEVSPLDPAPVLLTSGTPSQAEIDAFSTERCSAGETIVVPAFATAVNVIFNVIGLEGLYLTPEAVAGILTGSVTSFEDPLIADANEGFDLSGLPDITVYGTEEPTGSVQAMSAWLTKEVPDLWPAGEVAVLPYGEKFATGQEVLDTMIGVDASVTVMPTTLGVQYGLAPASLPATLTAGDGTEGDLVVMNPDDVQLGKIGSGATTTTMDDAGNIYLASPAVGGIPNADTFDFAASKVVVQEGEPVAGWPVLAFSHLMICNTPGDPLPLSFAQYVERLAGQGSLEGFGLTPLPEPVRFATFDPLKVVIDESAITGDVGPTQTETSSE